MAVPEEIRMVPRPTNTVVEAKVGKNGATRYIVRRRAGNVYRDGRSMPINGGVIGYIVDGQYVPRGEPRPIEPTEIDMQTWAVERILIDITPDLLEDLRKEYEEKDAERLYAMAILRVKNPGLVDCRMARDYRCSSLFTIFPNLAMSKNSISEFLQKVGGARNRMQRFLRHRIERIPGGRRLVVDGVLVEDNSDVNNLSAKSRKTSSRGRRDVSIIYACDVESREVVCFDVFPGNTVDSKAYSDFIEFNDLRDAILVGDKAFTANAAKKQFESDRNIHYLFPLRKNAKAIQKFGLLEHTGVLRTKPGVTYKVAHDTEKDIWYYSFRDLELAKDEEADFLAKLRKSGKQVLPEDLNEVRSAFGTIVFQSDIELTAEDAYAYYADRWQIETVFRMYKSLECLDETRVHSDQSVMGTGLVNYLSTTMTLRLLSHCEGHGLLEKRPFNEVLDTLSRSLRFSDGNGGWNFRAMMDYEKEILRELGLMPQLPPRRGPGRPPKQKSR